MAGDRRSASAAWLRPTIRAVPWRPLLLVAGALGGALALTHAAGAPPAPSTLVGAALALLAAAALLGLDDPARDVLAALPTTAARRRAHRLALLVPALAVAGAALLAVGRWSDVTSEPAGSVTATLAALTIAGLLVACLIERRRAELTAPAGAGAPVVWVLVATALPEAGMAGEVAHGWADRPWPWAAAGALAWAVACRRAPT